MDLRKRVFRIIQPAGEGHRTSAVFDRMIIVLIILSIVAVILESVESLREGYRIWFDGFEAVSVAIFSVEYLLRIWTCVEKNPDGKASRERMRFAFSFYGVVDVIAILPFYLFFLGIDLRFVRVFRLLRLAKLTRYNASFEIIKAVLRKHKEELVLTTGIMGLLLIVSSCLLYLAETKAQPEAFGSIPAAMWWSIATLTTVGYGDIFPVTALGKFFASIVAVLGVGMFALPTGLLGAGFVDEIQSRKKDPTTCPHCGKEID